MSVIVVFLRPLGLRLVSYGRLIRVGLVGPKLRAKAVSDGQLVSIPAPLAGRFKAEE